MRDLHRFGRKIDAVQIVSQDIFGDGAGPRGGGPAGMICKLFDNGLVFFFKQLIGRDEKRATAAGGIDNGNLAQGIQTILRIGCERGSGGQRID